MPVAGAGKATVIVPVATVHVGCVGVAAGAAGAGGAALIVIGVAADTQPPSFTVTL